MVLKWPFGYNTGGESLYIHTSGLLGDRALSQYDISRAGMVLSGTREDTANWLRSRGTDSNHSPGRQP